MIFIFMIFASLFLSCSGAEGQSEAHPEISLPDFRETPDESLKDSITLNTDLIEYGTLASFFSLKDVESEQFVDVRNDTIGFFDSAMSRVTLLNSEGGILQSVAVEIPQTDRVFDFSLGPDNSFVLVTDPFLYTHRRGTTVTIPNQLRAFKIATMQDHVLSRFVSALPHNTAREQAPLFIMMSMDGDIKETLGTMPEREQLQGARIRLGVLVSRETAIGYDRMHNTFQVFDLNSGSQRELTIQSAFLTSLASKNAGVDAQQKPGFFRACFLDAYVSGDSLFLLCMDNTFQILQCDIESGRVLQAYDLGVAFPSQPADLAVFFQGDQPYFVITRSEGALSRAIVFGTDTSSR